MNYNMFFFPEKWLREFFQLKTEDKRSFQGSCANKRTFTFASDDFGKCWGWILCPRLLQWPPNWPLFSKHLSSRSHIPAKVTLKCTWAVLLRHLKRYSLENQPRFCSKLQRRGKEACVCFLSWGRPLPLLFRFPQADGPWSLSACCNLSHGLRWSTASSRSPLDSLLRAKHFFLRVSAHVRPSVWLDCLLFPSMLVI